MNATDTLTPQAHVNAVHSVDQTFLFIFGASAALLVLLTLAMIWFVYRYNKKRHPVPAQFDGNITAEIIWTVLPTLLVMGMFWSGWSSYRALRDAPPDAMEVTVTARMWSWDFSYPNGRKSSTLVVPVGRPVKLALTSTDVIHGFYAPAFRIKIDTVPGMTTHAWFRAEKEGDYVIYCSVYCGLQHAKMLSSIRAVSEEEYERFLAGADKAGPTHPGRAVFEEKGCASCHTMDGSALVGPSLKGFFGREVVLIGADKKERKIVADAEYAKKTILGPKPGVVRGFEAVMPLYKGQLTDKELADLLDYLKEGDAPAGPTAEAGRAVAEGQGCVGCHSDDGTTVAGPSFKGMFGAKASAKGGGVIDRNYITDVLKDPTGRLGKTSVMPPYPGLSDAERESLLLYLESLGGGHKGAEAHQ